jgi:hypothetical protein
MTWIDFDIASFRASKLVPNAHVPLTLMYGKVMQSLMQPSLCLDTQNIRALCVYVHVCLAYFHIMCVCRSMQYGSTCILITSSKLINL